MHVDAKNTVQSVATGVSKFSDVKTMMNIQGLIKNISLNLDIFEFRYLDANGIVLNSMFEEEIGQKFDHPGLDVLNKENLGEFYVDERDMTTVLAVSFPVMDGSKTIGIIDLAIDISEFDFSEDGVKEIAIERMKPDTLNLLNAIAGSISTSSAIFETVDLFDFLNFFAQMAESIVEVAIIDKNGKVEVSNLLDESGKVLPGGKVEVSDGLTTLNGRTVFRSISKINPYDDDSKFLRLVIDAKDYEANSKQLLVAAITTSLLTIIFSLTIAYSIYKINLERAKKENLRLEAKVKERTREIGDIMDNVGQGIITVPENIVVNPEYSMFAESIFKKKPAGVRLSSLLYQDEKKAEEFDEWLEMFFDKNAIITFDDIVDMADSEVETLIDGKTKNLKIEYRPILDEDSQSVRKVMVVLSDITKEKELEAEREKERQEHERVVKILRDQDSFFGFLDDSRDSINNMQNILAQLMAETEGDSELINELFRGVHTIKGNASSFSINDVSCLAHEIESVFNSIREGSVKVTPELVESLRGQLHEIFENMESVVNLMTQLVGESFGAAGHKVVKVKEEKMSALCELLKKIEAPANVRNQLKECVEQMLKAPVGRITRRYPDMVKSIALELGKKVNVKLDVGDIEISGHVEHAIADPLIHILRNAVDHGIEEPQNRTAAGKPEEGTIVIECRETDDSIILAIKDDGGGIDPDKIRMVAQKKGVITESEARALSDDEAIAIIFRPDFSSREEATDLSGRGVGMDVVKTEVEAVGGSIRLESEFMKGTTITLIIPKNLKPS